MLDNKKLFYIGLAALGVLIVYSSTRKPELKELKEVIGTQEQKSFDNSELPIKLKPPYKMAEGDKFPTLNEKKLIGISFKPRFDAL
jgi:hypothetical protein